jgi:membrane protein
VASVVSDIWQLAKQTVLSFIEDEALTRGAAAAFYTATSLAPVLLIVIVIVIAVAGLFFGREATQNAVTGQLGGLMGQQTADLLQTAIKEGGSKSSSIIAANVGIITLVATASGAFGELQSALNVIWNTKPQGTAVRARAASREPRFADARFAAFMWCAFFFLGDTIGARGGRSIARGSHARR